MMSSDMAGIERGLSDLATGLRDLKTDLRSDIRELRGEVATGLHDLRQNGCMVGARQDSAITGLTANLAEHQTEHRAGRRGAAVLGAGAGGLIAIVLEVLRRVMIWLGMGGGGDPTSGVAGA